MEEEVQIYEDIDFIADYHTIKIPDEKIDILAQRISKLIGEKMEMDILITKEWSTERLKKLITKLREYEIEVKKVYYISPRTSRFTDSFIISESVNKTKHPYHIVGDKVAFLRTSTGLRMYANLSHLYIKLMWPEDAKIEESDLMKVLWLVKKRIYRLQEWDVLKIPEPMHIFGNIKNMYLGEFKETLTLPLRLLI